MKAFIIPKLLWVIVLLYIIIPSIQSQNNNWQNTHERTFVFEITNKEALKLLKNPRDSLIHKMLHTPVASFINKWDNPPEQGHFIHANIYKNIVYYDYVPIIPFQVFIFKEYGKLTLQIIDKEGNIRDNAKVKITEQWRIFNKRVDFDKESQTYRIDDWSENTNRILTVELDNFRAIFNLQKHLVSNWDNSYNDFDNKPQFYSYMITDKNKYKPNETVRFKSYALSGNKRPLKQDLEVWMKTDPSKWEYKKISTLSPYNPGGYAGEIELHDSLKLKLDKTYSIQLRDKRKRIVANTLFRYEDYELFDSKLEIKSYDKSHYYPETNYLEIKATDANNLLLQDVKADIYIHRNSVSQTYTDVFVLSDTISHEKISLDNTQNTIYPIPADLFGNANCVYKVEVVVLTHDNQRLVYNDLISFYKSHYDITTSTRNDTLCFDFKKGGKPQKVKGVLRYNNSKEIKEVELPYEELFKQATVSYDFTIPEYDYHKQIFTYDQDPLLDMEGGLVADSFNIKLINPLALDVSWYIYQGNILLQKGSGKELDFKYADPRLDVTHYVEVFYFMGDKEEVYRRTFVPKTQYLSLDLDMPDRIYPGQTLDATITVKDHFEKPVKGVDLTAFAVNTMLGYEVPDLPYYGDLPGTREKRATYSIDQRKYIYYNRLDYEFWNKIAGLDTMLYYRITYPQNGRFVHTIDTPDSTTQFAPFIMKNGDAVNIYVIERDEEPLYFSWTNQLKNYSFPADTLKKTITLRLHDRLIILPDMKLEKGKKTIISLDPDNLPPDVRVQHIYYKDKEKRNIFTPNEVNKYSQYTCLLPVSGESYSFLTQDGYYYPISYSCTKLRKNKVLAGPIRPRPSRYNNGVEYKHEGGFSYEFDSNVIYKYPEKVCPEYLLFKYDHDILSSFNDFQLNRNSVEKLVKECQSQAPWHPRYIRLYQKHMDLNFHLPVEKDSTGVANLLFRNTENDSIFYPNIYENGKWRYADIPSGVYDIIVLYNSAKYLMKEDVSLKSYAYTGINMSNLLPHDADSLSHKWLLLKEHTGAINDLYERDRWAQLIERPVNKSKRWNTITGFVYDPEGEPLIGCTVRIKGTTFGTITNMDGYFELDLSGINNNTLEISYIGYKTKELNVRPGTEIIVKIEEYSQMLQEVAVIGYGLSKRSYLTGSVAGISVNNNTPQAPQEKLEEAESRKRETEEAESRLYQELLQLNGLRSNFSDVGFWQPSLITDKQGEAQFNVTFPDNITKWDAVVYAMNRKLKTGTLRKSIRSYKPLMAELRVPQFLVEGDISYFAGNIRNYTNDKEISGEIVFVLESDTLLNNPIVFSTSHQDKIPVTAVQTTDSLTATYLFSREDGYSDGEKRSIPIEKQGTEIEEGILSFMTDKAPFRVAATENENIDITITGNQLDVYMNVAHYLWGYRYACNEQLASKLTGLLNYKIYQEYTGNKFKYDNQVNRIIKRLVNNQNRDKLWSWWGNSTSTSFWMSAHILRALSMAKNTGYTVNLNMKKVEDDYVYTRSYRTSSLNDIEILHALSEWNTQQNYKEAVLRLEKEVYEQEAKEDSIARVHKKSRTKSYLKEKLLLWEIKQKQDAGYVSDSVAKYLKKDILGSVYCDDDIKRSWYNDELATTLIAYRIIKNDSLLTHHKEAMQMYIMRSKRFGWNTYQASSALTTVLPDLVKAPSGKNKIATVLVQGKENKEITEFPYSTTLNTGEYLDIEKVNGVPLIFSASSVRHVTQERESDAFSITTSFKEGDILTAGKPVELIVKVNVKQENPEYVMIEIPIPAGCSYHSKPGAISYNKESHREYFKEKTVIFCENLPQGEYEFSLSLLPRYTGKYTLNPAKVELMYFPVINANNDMRGINIEN